MEEKGKRPDLQSSSRSLALTFVPFPSQTALKMKVTPSAVLGDDLLELIAVILPIDEQSLTEEIEGMTDSKISQLGVSPAIPVIHSSDFRLACIEIGCG